MAYSSTLPTVTHTPYIPPARSVAITPCLPHPPPKKQNTQAHAHIHSTGVKQARGHDTRNEAANQSKAANQSEAANENEAVNQSEAVNQARRRRRESETLELKDATARGLESSEAVNQSHRTLRARDAAGERHRGVHKRLSSRAHHAVNRLKPYTLSPEP